MFIIIIYHYILSQMGYMQTYMGATGLSVSIFKLNEFYFIISVGNFGL